MTLKEYLNGTIEYDEYGQYLWLKNQEGQLTMLGEIRGWGHIQNVFRRKDDTIDFDKAGKLQDEIGKFVAEAINEKIKKLHEA